MTHAAGTMSTICPSSCGLMPSVRRRPRRIPLRRAGPGAAPPSGAAHRSRTPTCVTRRPRTDIPVRSATPTPATIGFWTRACRALVDLFRKQGIVTAFVRLHPVLPAPTDRADRRRHDGPPWQTCLAGPVARPRGDVAADRTGRTATRSTRRAGPTCRSSSTTGSRLDDWIDIYHANMRRVGASDFYFFAPDALPQLRRTLGDQAHLAAGARGRRVARRQPVLRVPRFHAHLPAGHPRRGHPLRRQAALRRDPAVGPGSRQHGRSTSAAGWAGRTTPCSRTSRRSARAGTTSTRGAW